MSTQNFNVHNSIHKSSKLEIAQISSEQWMDKQNVKCPYNGIALAIYGTVTLMHATEWSNLETLG